MGVFIITLAAGDGTRMKSDTPKPLHEIAGKTILDHSLSCFEEFKIEKKILVASENLVRKDPSLLDKFDVCIQEKKLGTGHAVLQAEKFLQDIKENDLIIVNYGDTPFISKDVIFRVLNQLNNYSDLVVLGFETNDISQKYGRLITNENELIEIIEYKDASEEIRSKKLCNSGIMSFRGKLFPFLNLIKNINKSSEYYLTDLVKIAKENQFKTSFVICEENEVIGINSRYELSKAENLYQEKLRKKHMENGVTLLNPNSVYFSHDTEIENDVKIEENVHFGLNVKIKSNTIIKAFSYLEGCEIFENCIVGPFARIRPNSNIQKGAHIGNFVEIKNSEIKDLSKINHLSYIGDSKIGNNSNIGAGVVTCNYDGFKKNTTTIGNYVFIGSNSSLIAPVSILDNSIIAAGSTITKDVEENSIAISRVEQKNIQDGAKKYKIKKQTIKKPDTKK